MSFNLQIHYGIPGNLTDITTKVYALTSDSQGEIHIPSSDNKRAELFGDPIYGTSKSIFITDRDITTEFDNTVNIIVNRYTGLVKINESPSTKLAKIHSKLQLRYGSFHEEYPEQLMVARFLTGTEKVLEIGGNIGRNSLVIASILNQTGNTSMVTLESDPEIAGQLTENRDLNGLKFQIEPSALSKNRLIQRGWDTLESNVLKPGYKWVSTITLAELYAKYGVQFDTLVLDCEGAFYYILRDMPEILEPVNLVIMENDYTDINHKEAVDAVLVKAGFRSIYQEAGGWGPCKPRFFEVFRKN
jgi:FkbM family methyltransferase